MLEEEREGNKKIFQIQQRRTYCKESDDEDNEKMIKRRVLAKISSRYGMRDLCKFSEKIYYSKPTK